MNPPRRPLVPGPNQISATAGVGTISERAIAMREESAGQLARPIGQQPEAGLVQLLERPQGRPPVVIGPVGNMAGAIAAVMCKVGTIKKGGFNAYHKYHYARMEDLLEVLTPLMGENGLAYTQDEIEIKNIEGNRVAVNYEFVMMHKSGETTRVRQSGMAIARDSKGNWDDKSIAKCHTNARKQYLLGQFNVPSGDFEDSDKDDANQRQEQRPVPGPKQAEPKSTSREAAPSEASGPHRIALGPGAGADQWAGAYIKAIGSAKSEAEIKEWDAANDSILQSLSEKYAGVYDQIDAAVQRRFQDLGVSVMPDLKPDAQEAMNWVANQLQGFTTYEAAEAFWNLRVAPREAEFGTLDWEMLMGEWKRAETRLAPPQEETPGAA